MSEFREKRKETRSERTKCQERKGGGSRERGPWQSLKSAPAEDIDWRVGVSHLGSCWTKQMAKSPRGQQLACHPQLYESKHATFLRLSLS